MASVYKINHKRNNFFNNISLNSTLIIINLIAFLIFSILLIINQNNPELVYEYLAIKPANILNGDYLWTFVTSMFLHGGFFHIFANMFSLFFAGSLIERILGRKRYFYFYMISGLFAGLFFVLSSFFLKSDFNTYAVGASGALFGLIGLLIILTPNLPVYVMFIPIPFKIKYAGPIMLFVLWLISITGNIPIGNTAHLGGLIAGLIYGFYLKTKYKNKTKMISQYFS